MRQMGGELDSDPAWRNNLIALSVAKSPIEAGQSRCECTVELVVMDVRSMRSSRPARVQPQRQKAKRRFRGAKHKHKAIDNIGENLLMVTAIVIHDGRAYKTRTTGYVKVSVA